MAVSLGLLDAREAELNRILVDGTLGPSVRLEQEPVGFAAIERALAGLQDGQTLPLPVEWASGPTDRW